jgi:hypothetical protein
MWMATVYPVTAAIYPSLLGTGQDGHLLKHVEKRGKVEQQFMIS